MSNPLAFGVQGIFQYTAGLFILLLKNMRK